MPDPNEIIGVCQYCEGIGIGDSNVTYAGGDIDEHGKARHDRCWKLVCDNELQRMRMTVLCGKFLECVEGMDSKIRHEISALHGGLQFPLQPHAFSTFLCSVQKTVEARGLVDEANRIKKLRSNLFSSAN